MAAIHANSGQPVDGVGAPHEAAAPAYLDQSLHQRLEQLRLGALFGRNLIVIEGPEGLGKTRLLGLLLHRLPTGWRHWQIEAASLMGDLDMAAQLERQTGMPWSESTAPSPITGRALLAIDDADRLDADRLVTLIRAVQAGDGVARARLVLTGHQGFSERLLAIPSSPVDGERLDIFHWPRLDEDQSVRYVVHRMAVLGLDTSPFDGKALMELAHQGGGLPGRLNQLLADRLDAAGRGGAGSSGRRRVPPWWLRQRSMLILGGGIVVAAVVLSYWQSGEFRGLRSNQDEMGREKPAVPKPPAPARTVNRTNSTGPVGSLVTPPEAELRFEVPSPSSEVEQAKRSDGDQPAEGPKVVGEPRQSAHAPIEATSLGREGQPTAPEAPIAVPTPDVPGRPPTAGPGESNQEFPGVDWLRRQPPDAFTLQMLAMRDRKSLEDFARALPKGPPVAVVKRRTDGLNILLYGVYESRKAASEALAALPARVKNSGPWPRMFREIQDQLPARSQHANPG